MAMESVFGDIRLDKRLERLTEQMSSMSVANLPQSLTEWSSLKAGYRFMNNAKVSHSGIIETEQQATRQRIEADSGSILLAVQDTTSFNFSGRSALQGLGVLEDNRTPGFFAHSTLAVSEEGVPLGVLGQEVWSRPQNLARDKQAHKQKPITEKESFKWLQSVRQLPDTSKRIVTVCDREADIYELFQEAANQNMDYIVRASHNRCLEDAPLLRHHLDEISVAATYMIKVRRQVNQPERMASVELRYTTVTLSPPKRLKSAVAMDLHPVTVQVVEVKEIAPPSDVKEPIHWILLTTLPVNNLDDAYRIVRYYTYRWLVERFHFVLKSGGCDFESSQLRTVEALHRLLAICSRVAWYLLWLTYEARQHPSKPCTAVLTKTEWQALTAFTNKSNTAAASPPTLQQAVRAIAQLGGFIGRKSDGDPGVKTLWRGWQRFQDIVATWSLFYPSQRCG
jgi:hypothetical protein